MNWPEASVFVRRHQVCTGIKRAAHVWCARRHTHTRVMPNTRQREAREGLSVHAETAHSVDPAISETNDSVVASRGYGVAPSIAEDPVSRRRRIEGRSMTLTDHAARLTDR